MMKSAYFIHWMGNKFAQRKNLRLALPERFDQIIEPFAGTAGFSRTLVDEGVINPTQVWANDTYAPRVSLWHVIANGQINEMVARLYEIRNEHGIGDRDLFDKHFKRYLQNLPDMEQAVSFFIVNRLTGGSFMVGDVYYEDPLLDSMKGLRIRVLENLREAGLMMEGCRVTSGDYQQIKPHSENTFLLIDPPYPLGPKKEKRFYGAPFFYQRFATWCHRIRDMGKILITFDDNERHLSNFRNWHIY